MGVIPDTCTLVLSDYLFIAEVSVPGNRENGMNRSNKSGFSMIELLVVLLIIGILAAVAAPLFLGNSDKAKLSEAVAALGSIRAGERSYYAQNGSYITNIAAADAKAYFGTGGASSTKLGVILHGNKYFSVDCFTVGTTSPGTAITNPQDFVIVANGANSVAVASATDDGARNPADVSTLQVQMDNTGAVFYKVGSGSWTAY